MTGAAGPAKRAIVTAPLRLLLDGDALVANWRWLAARQPGAACGAAVKADGYGLGAPQVVARLAAGGCRDFFVATWDEAAQLGPLPGGIALSVLHGVRGEDMAAALASPARPVLNSAAQVARWREAGGGACDVMVDTGINRLGLRPEEACSGLLDGLAIETLISHLACADEPGHPLNARQREAFAAVVPQVRARRASLANSAGVLLGPDYGFGLTRPGLALYGGRPVAGMEAIRQVVRPAAQVIQCRTVRAGETVGYGATFRAAADTAAAVLNIGYADGYFRAFAGNGAAFAGDRRCPLIGRVSMDMVVVGTDGADVREGDWLTIEYDLPAASAATGLSQYELLAGLGQRFERHWI